MTITASEFQMPGGIETYEDYKKAQAAPKYYESSADVNGEMGQQEFLLLFTTQLQNQNPLDPMKNEEFVAQLAQFSQLEATTTMAAGTIYDSTRDEIINDISNNSQTLLNEWNQNIMTRLSELISDDVSGNIQLEYRMYST